MGIVLTGTGSLTKQEKISPASKFIELLEYDPKQNTLDITFKSGTKYRYLQVYPATYSSFKESPTIDAFYSRAIKGNLMSVKLVDNTIGRKKSAPLKKITEEHTLNAGLKQQQSRERGTVDRAFAA